MPIEPHSPLPWRRAVSGEILSSSGNRVAGYELPADKRDQDRAYAVHACNDYPRLLADVERLRAAARLAYQDLDQLATEGFLNVSALANRRAKALAAALSATEPQSQTKEPTP